MRKSVWLEQTARVRKRLLEWTPSWCGYLALIAVSAVGAFLGCAAIPGEARQTTGSASPPGPERRAVNADDALYVHDKLMQVGVGGDGTPVLRFVECRHYPKEHMKLAQVGVTSAGTAVLRLIAGDRGLLPPPEASPSDTVMPALARSGDLQGRGSRRDRSSLAGVQPEGVNGRLAIYQQYVCEKFGPACPIALAVQLAENPTGACEIYHYNSSDGTLDWGFFQINTVHLSRPGLNLHDLLDCRKNIDFAYQLFQESGFEPWTAYRTGAYLRFLVNRIADQYAAAVNRSLIGNQLSRPSLGLF
jgi:hypothetical protein